MSILGRFLKPMEIAQLWPLMPLWSHFGPFLALREPKYEILAQNLTLRRWSDFASLKPLITKVNRRGSKKVFKHSKTQLWASWDHYCDPCNFWKFWCWRPSGTILGHFLLSESQNMSFGPKSDFEKMIRFCKFEAFNRKSKPGRV